MKKQVGGFWHAVAFLTRFPVPGRLEEEAWEASPPFYPVVGLFLGAAVALAVWALGVVAPGWVAAMLTVTLWVYLTGGLHLDGVMDTADGFGSYRSRERVLEIMKDSRVGAMGVLAAVLLLGNKVAALAALPAGSMQAAAVVLAAVVGRTAMLAVLYGAPYARENGLANSLRFGGRWERVWPFLFAAVAVAGCAVWLQGSVAVAVLLAAGAAVWLVRVAQKKIGGCTGDVYGAVCEVTETVVLVALTLGGVR
ncbi:adenosylcobinamide-GDP ribazoletransferase [Tumebacillus sp. DT12]|uniref:Adenosylcobinamide-GDP ribazoletransferase n=1 Tax=Tumebacillus lacus TaxID=2995335 RepID=A0ABT3WX73_9BACL|nr:adenosylcobinamide-GDP ribazoletransferase [Tumebacillus lacus]MCX7569265.1 adenosylcobinamide-GDP ribazoletransferase [Tumebacillus lacus]